MIPTERTFRYALELRAVGGIAYKDWHRMCHQIQGFTFMITRHISGPIHHRIVEHGDTVYIGGLVADDKTKDMKGQAEEIFAKLDKLLETAGTSKQKLLQVMVYSSDFNQKDGFNEAWKEWLAPEDMPVRAYLGVSDLSPNTLVEVVTIAAK